MYKSEHFNKIGNDVGSFLVGNSVPRLILTYYIVFLIFNTLRNTKPFGAWRAQNTVSGDIILNIEAFTRSILFLMLTILWAYLFTRSRHSTLPGKLSLIAGYLLFALTVTTAIDVSNFNPNLNDDVLGPADNIVLFTKTQLSNWYSSSLISSIPLGIILGMFIQ